MQKKKLGVGRGEHSKPKVTEVSLVQLGELAWGEMFCKPPASRDVRGRAPHNIFLGF